MGGQDTPLSFRVRVVIALTNIAEIAKDRDLTFLAAGFAFYAFVSLIPLVLLALVVGSIVGGERVAEQLVLVAGDFLPEAGEALVVEALTTESGRAEATVVAVAVSSWGALKVFRGLSLSFDRIYGSEAVDSILEQIRDGVLVIGVIAVALALMIGVGIAMRIAPDVLPAGVPIGWLLLLTGLVGVFVPMYIILPPIAVSFREALPGASFAAIGWLVLQAGFQLYAANAGRYAAYGAVGAMILFVTWLYFAGIVILLGAAINVALAPRDSQ